MKTRCLTTILNVILFAVGVWICDSASDKRTVLWKWNLVTVILTGLSFCNNLGYDTLVFFFRKEDEGECTCGLDLSLGDLHNPFDVIIGFGRLVQVAWGIYVYTLGHTPAEYLQWLYLIVLFWLNIAYVFALLSVGLFVLCFSSDILKKRGILLNQV